MALISLRQLLDHAAEHGYGVPAFNVNNLEQMRAIMLAADQTNSPVIVQASAGARKYAGAPFLRHLILAAIEEWPHIPVVMHQDHGTSPAVCQRSIQLGFSSVMMDGSLQADGKTPADYDYNVRVTREVVAMAHACGVSVEGEIGCLGSLETGMAGEEDGVGAEGVLDHSQLLTSVEEARQFVADTGVDALAIAIGTSHGAYKFTSKPTGKVLRSWGKGAYKIPHGIRIDPAGNVWTLDANLSKVFKYTPDGKQLLTFEVGEIPDAKRPFCSITDIAFSPTGTMLVAERSICTQDPSDLASGSRAILSPSDALSAEIRVPL